MTHALRLIAALAIAVPPLAGAMGQTAPSADQRAKYTDEAQKSCDYDLDHDRFGSYSTMDECVSDRASKLARQDQTKAVAAQTAARTHQPN